MKKILKFVGIVFVILLVIGISGNKDGKDSFKQGMSDAQKTSPISSENPEGVVTTVTHADLLKLVQNDSDSILNNKYDVVGYLEQQPTKNNAFFMSQNDPNSKETILISCDMSSGDISKLDGESAQKGIKYSEYKLEVEFTKYVEELSYNANCSLK